MQKLKPRRALDLCVSAFALLALAACQTAPKAAPPEPKPVVVAPKPPTEPFIALAQAKKDPRTLDLDGDGHVTRRRFKDRFLHAFSRADRLDGKVDGLAPIAGSCQDFLELCKSADANGDGNLSVKEFLDRLDGLFEELDRNHDGVLVTHEVLGLEEL